MIISFLLSALALVSSFFPQPTITEGVVGQPKSLNVLDIGTNQPDRDIAKFIHRGLMKYDANGNLVTDLAESYKISSDKKEYTFFLRKGILWHNGKTLTSNDVIYTVSKLNLQSVSVDKLDEYTVRFQLARDVYSPFLDLMTQYILPVNYDREEKSGIYQIGLGDFRVARIVKSDKVDSVILTLFRPWVKNKYGFSRIIFKFYANNKDLALAAKLGEVDTFGSNAIIDEIGSYQKISSPLGSRYYALFFNLKKDVLKDRDLRKFLASKVKKEEITDGIFNSNAVISLEPLEYTFVEPTISSVGAAKKSEYKFKNSLPMDLALTVPQPLKGGEESDSYKKIALLIKSEWESSYLRVNIKEVPLDKIFTEVVAKKDFDVLLFGQEVSRDPDVYNLWHSAQKDLPGLNFTSFSSVLVDRLLEDGRKSFTKEERTNYYKNFIKIFDDEMPAVFLYHPLYHYYFRKNIFGPNLKGFFYASDRFANFEEWKRM